MAQESELRNVMRVMDGGGRGRNPDAVPGKMPEIPLTPRKVPPLLYLPTRCRRNDAVVKMKKD